MFWDKFVELCNQNKTTPNAVGKAINISSAAISYWKNGSQPRDTAIKKICDYFNVSIDYFKDNAYDSDEASFTYAAYNELTHDLTSAQIEQLKTFANFLRQQK